METDGEWKQGKSQNSKGKIQKAKVKSQKSFPGENQKSKKITPLRE
jgi:hypothetical protein